MKRNLRFWLLLAMMLSIHISLYAADDTSPKLIKGDVLKVAGAQPVSGVDGMGYLDLGTWAPNKEYSFVLKRPKGADANYPVSIWYQVADLGLYTLERDNRYGDNFYSRPLTQGDENQPYEWDGWNCIVFKPGETEKTITVLTPEAVSYSEYREDLSGYVRFSYGNRTTVDYDMVQLRLHNPAATPLNTVLDERESVKLYSAGLMSRADMVKSGEWVVVNVELKGSKHWFDSDFLNIVVDENTRFAITTGSGTKELVPLQPAGTNAYNQLLFAYRADDNDITAGDNSVGSPLKGQKISNVKAGGASFDVDMTWDLYYNMGKPGCIKPKFGDITLDKTTYSPRELVTMRVKVSNWEKLNAVYGDEWLNCVALTSDGGETTINSANPALDTTSGELVFTFNAMNPAMGATSATHYAEIMVSGVLLSTDDTNAWWVTDRLPYLLPADAFFSYYVEGQPVIVNTESIEITGMPEGNEIRKNMVTQQFKLDVSISPANCSFMKGTWKSSNTDVATVSASGLVEVTGSGFTDITFTSEEYDYLTSIGQTPNTERLKKTVRLHVMGVLPDDSYQYKYFTSDDETVLITAVNVELTHYYNYIYHALPDWEFTSDKATVVLRHHDSDKYSDITLDAPIEKSGISSVVSVVIPFNDKTFLRKRYQDQYHSAEPTCTAHITIPARNKNDGEEHTYTCTFYVYHDLTNAESATSLSDEGAVTIDENGNGHAQVTFKKLDREEGFKLEMQHRVYDGVSDIVGTYVGQPTEYCFNRTFEPGEIELFEGEKKIDDNIVLRMMPDRKYVEATLNLDFKKDNYYTNVIRAGAMNIYSSLTRENAYGYEGAVQLYYKGSPLISWDNPRFIPTFYRLKGAKSGEGGRLDDEHWVSDNKDMYDNFMSDWTEENFNLLNYSNYIYFYPYAPNTYGDMHIVYDGQETIKVIPAGSAYDKFLISCPFDDKSHTLTFKFPDAKLEKTFSYTCYGKELRTSYILNIESRQYDLTDVEFEVNYTTLAGNNKTHYATGKSFVISDPEGIAMMSVTDHVGEGEDHRFIAPTIVNNPTPIVSDVNTEMELDPQSFKEEKLATNLVKMQPLDKMYVKFVDAKTGLPICDNVTIYESDNSSFEAEFNEDGAMSSSYHSSCFEVNAQGYMPRRVQNIKFKRASVLIDGQEVFLTDGKVTYTLPLYPATEDAFVSITKVETEETNPVGEGTISMSKIYSGSDMFIPYDGSIKPGRAISVELAFDQDAVEPTYLYITSPEAKGKQITLKKQSNTWISNTLNHHFVTYSGELRDFLYSETEGETFISDGSGQSVSFLKMKNIDKNPMGLIDGMEIAPNLPTTEVGQASRGINIGKMQNQFDNFSLQLPSTLPFTLVVEKENDDYIFKALYAQNFLPGGKMMDLMDKTDFIGDVDRYIYELKQMTRPNRRKDYNPDDRLFAFPTAFAGIRAWAEGRLVYDYDKDRYSFAFGGMGVKAEASAYVKAKIPLGFGSFGTSLEGEVSAQVKLERPSQEDCANAMYPCPMDITFDFLTSLKVSAYAELGIDLWIAAAKAGIRGSAWGSFESMMTTKPYLGGETEGGIRMELGAWLEAYAKAKFLFWSKTWRGKILDVNGVWYVPNSDSNPLKVADKANVQKRVSLRSSIYKPLRLSAIPENTKLLLSNIDAYAQPMYLYGGDELAYIRPNSSETGCSQVKLKSGKEFQTEGDRNVFDLDAFSRTVSGQKKGVLTYMDSGASESSDASAVANSTAVYASLGDGSSWSTPYKLSEGYNSNLTPKATVSPTGKTAVVWKAGDFVSADNAEDPTEGYMNGHLLMACNDGSTWNDYIPSMFEMNKARQISDYSVAMCDDVPMVVGTIIQTQEDGNISSKLAAFTMNENLPMNVCTDIVATQPQVVALGDGYYVGAMVTSDNGKADVQLMKLSRYGEFTDVGTLGLANRNIVDYKLIAPESASGLDGLAIVWKESLREYTDFANNIYDVKTAIYGARISRSEEGLVYLSCPQQLLKQDDDLVVTYYDAVFNNNTITAAITVADDETDGANVLTSSVTFENSLKCEYAGLAGQIVEGKDISLSFVVMNEGYQAIDYVDINVNGKLTTVKVNILPGYSEEVTAMAPATTDLNQPINFDITPYFVTSPMLTRSVTMARQKANPGVRKVMAATKSGMGSLSVNVVDIAVSALSTATKDDGNTKVVAAVYNMSPVSFKDGWSVKVGVYKDAAGTMLYSDKCVATVPASKLYGSDGNNSTNVAFDIDGIESNTTLYLVAYTIDADGNVVTDQVSANNMSPVVAYVAEKTSTKVVTAAEASQRFKVVKRKDGVELQNVVAGDNIRVYDAAGQLLNWTVASQTTCLLPIHHYGVYIITNGRQTEKIRYGEM